MKKSEREHVHNVHTFISSIKRVTKNFLEVSRCSRAKQRQKKCTKKCAARAKLLLLIRPRPHVSGDFCIRKFFYADTKISASTRSVYESYTTVHTYPIRIRTSQRISQQSMRITSAYTKIYGYERPHVSGYTASVYRNFHSGERIQKSPFSGVACLRRLTLHGFIFCLNKL